MQAASLVRDAVTSIDLGNLAQAMTDLNLLVASVSRTYGMASASLSATHYSEARLVAGIVSQFTPIPADPASADKVGATVGWATAPLRMTEPDIEAAQRNLIAGVEKLVLDAGRNTIIDNVQRDRKAHGWYRVTEPKPCYFCALIATRGPVYRSEQTADFKAHDHCRCHASPNFGDYTMPNHVQEWLDLYRDATTGGNSAKTRREWRKAFTSTYSTT